MGTEAPRSTRLFFALALGLTLALQLPAVLASRGILPGGAERFMPLLGLGVFGPVVAAIVAAWREGGRARVREIFWPPTRVPAFAYVGALLLFPAIAVASSGWLRLAGGDGAWAYLPETSQHVAGMVMMPLVEEPGWRGFAMPRLAARYGPLPASLILGVLWAVWHTMMFLVQWPGADAFALGMLNIAAGSVIFGWLFVRTRGSLLAAVLAHVGTHLDNPSHALPEHLPPFVAYTLGVAVVAAVLVLADRRAWRRPPDRSLSR